MNILRLEKQYGEKGAKLYQIWQGMKQRCSNKNHVGYRYYGGRGIKVCDSWFNSFESFREDMGDQYQIGLSIERINVNRGYDSENCKWIPRNQQPLNQTPRKMPKSGHRGVYQNGAGWRPVLVRDKKRIALGTYKTIKEASLAYNNLTKAYHDR